MSAPTETATFAAGCFWGVEVDFRNTPGVTAARVGYAGGTTESPTYEQVCSGGTGHAEAVEVTFDPSEISYAELARHVLGAARPDPGQPSGLGRRHAVPLGHLHPLARAGRGGGRVEGEGAGALLAPIATEIVAAPTFWPAEEYHQQYLVKNGRATCRI